MISRAAADVICASDVVLYSATEHEYCQRVQFGYIHAFEVPGGEIQLGTGSVLSVPRLETTGDDVVDYSPFTYGAAVLGAYVGHLEGDPGRQDSAACDCLCDGALEVFFRDQQGSCVRFERITRDSHRQTVFARSFVRTLGRFGISVVIPKPPARVHWGSGHC